ncbi:hypothetical protein DFO66_11932 [Brevibacterium sanguinis]|uniref:Uncharacterized protein n=2 Tax=Brevibacterium TaxID=1696 RepID=A0A366IPM3_9MICO|nr:MULTISPECIES: hypothetical protein [Brevibacterium]RBP61708.1 hypothetical protein DFO66_11932 [Brevibacterium sanguinis]RBP74311.1 hypothetical protein DFO65_10128 [Brevibacterium celere]
MSGVNEDHYQPSTHPGDIIEVWDEEQGKMVRHRIILDEFGNGTKTVPVDDAEE